MKLKGKIKSIEYDRYEGFHLCPGSLFVKYYFLAKSRIEIDYGGVFHVGKFTRREKQQSRPFLFKDS